MEVNQTPYQKRYEDFRVGRFRAFGGIQIALGIICAFLSIVGIGIDSTNMSKSCDRPNYYDYYVYYYSYYYYKCRNQDLAVVYLGFNITCFLFSGWIIMTGLFPFCMNEKKERKWTCLKTAFMVCSILGSVIFIPTIFSLGVTGAIIRGVQSENSSMAILPSILAFFSSVELIVAIAAASYCCCCWSSKSRIYPIFINEVGQPFVVLTNSQWTEIDAYGQGSFGQTLVPLQGAYPIVMNQHVTQAPAQGQSMVHQHHLMQQPTMQQQQIGLQQQQIGLQQQQIGFQQQYSMMQPDQPTSYEPLTVEQPP